MKSYIHKGLGFVVLLGLFMALGGIKGSEAGVKEELSIRPPPPVALHGPHPVVVIPGTYVYMVPDIDVSILFYDGYWYRPCEGSWFRADSNNGPWVYIKPSGVPWALTELPPEYRREPCG
jgi:hypothetical protein